MKMDLFMSTGKQPSLYIMFAKYVGFVRPLSPEASGISGVMSSGPDLFHLHSSHGIF